MSQAQKRKFPRSSTEYPDDEGEDVDVKKPRIPTQDGKSVDTPDTLVHDEPPGLNLQAIQSTEQVKHTANPNFHDTIAKTTSPSEPYSGAAASVGCGNTNYDDIIDNFSQPLRLSNVSRKDAYQNEVAQSSMSSLPGGPVIEVGPNSFNVKKSGALGLTVIYTDGHAQHSGEMPRHVPSDIMEGSNEVMMKDQGQRVVKHQRPRSSGVQHQYPGSSGGIHQCPTSPGGKRQHPGSSGGMQQHPRLSGRTQQHYYIDGRFKNICDATEVNLKDWTRTIYVSTYAERSALKLLKHHGCIFIKGKAGCGKSRLGRQLLEEMSKVEGRTPLLLTSADEWSLIPNTGATNGTTDNSSSKYIVMIDDIFGLTNFTQSYFDNWTRKFDIMWPRIESGHIFLILTSRSEITAQCQSRLKKHSLMKNICHFLIDDGKYSLQKKEKEKMLKVICHDKLLTFSKGEVEEILRMETALGFPQVCTFFASSKAAQSKGLSFFKKPNEYVLEEVDALRESDGLGYLVLLLVLMSGGSLDSTLDPRKCTSEFKEKIEIVKEYCPNLPTCLSLFDIKTKADSLCGVYLIQCQKGYAFQHQSIYESVFISISKQYPSSCIKSCPADVLLEVVRTVRLDGDMNVVLIPADDYAVFADRITELLLSAELGISERILRHPSLKHEAFISFLVQRWTKNEQLTNIMQCKHFGGYISYICGYEENRIFNYDYLLSTFVMNSHDHLVQFVLNSIPSPDQFKDTIHECLPCAVFTGNDNFVKWFLDHGAVPNENCVIALLVHSGHDLKNDLIDRIFNGFITSYVRENKLCYSPELGKGYVIGPNLAELLQFAVCFGSTHIVQLTVNMLMHKDDNLNVFSDILSSFFDQMQTHHPRTIVVSSRECLKEKIKIMLSTGCKLHCQHLLLSASAHSDSTALEHLLNLETHILQTRNYTDDKRYTTKYETPQEQAAAYGSPESLDILLKDSKNISQHFGVATTANFLLHRAAQHGNTECANFLLQNGFQIDLKDNDINTPLHLAVQNNHLECVKLLLKHKASVKQENCEGLIPLSIIETVNHEIVRALIEAGSNVNQMDGRGRTLLHKAVQCNDQKTLNFLCHKEADVNTNLQCISQTSVVHLACQYADIAILKLLCDSGAHVEAMGADKKPAVHMAAGSHIDALEKLTFLIDDLKHHPDAEDSWGRTALFSAVDTHADTYGVEVLEFLLNRGVSVNCSANKDILPYLLRTSLPQNKMFDLLVKRSVDVNETALRLVIEDMNIDAARPILEHVNFDPNRRDELGKTYLHYATEQRKSELWERYEDAPQSNAFCQYVFYSARKQYVLTEMLLKQGVNPRLQDIVGRNPLHYAAGYGKPNTVKLLLEKGVDPNARDGMGWTPFHMAADLRRYRTVGVLLDNGIDANIQDNQGMTALHIVVMNRGLTLQKLEEDYDFSGICRLDPSKFLHLFLEKGVDPNIQDKLGRTALHYASGHSEISSVKLLLDYGASPNVKDLQGMTSLHCASTRKASFYHENTLPLLLEKSVCPNIQDRRGKTALHYVSETLDGDHLKLLLEHGADPSLKDQQGMTALHCAAKRSTTDIKAFRILLETDVDPNIIDEQGKTALHYASEHSHEDCIKILLDHSADPNVQDLHGLTPVHVAAMNFHYNNHVLEIMLVKILDPNVLDKKGRTALHYASEHLTAEHVKLLLDHDANPCIQDLQGMTPLHFAATNCHNSCHILKLLLEKGVDPNVLDKKGRTALHYASEHLTAEHVKLLLDHGADPCIQDLQGMTPLHFAATNCHNSCHILKLLLEKGVDPNVLDKKGRTALHYASEHLTAEHVKLLLDHGADPCVQDLQGMTSLHLAATSCHNSCHILKLLLEKGVDPNVLDKKGRTALHYASEHLTAEHVKLLLDHGADPCVQDLQGMTSLHLAATSCHNSCHILKLLLEKSVDPNVLDKKGRTALHNASGHLTAEHVKLLLDHGADPCVQDLQGMTSLHLAATSCHNSCHILKLLLEKCVDPNVLDNKGRTALHYVSEHSDKDCIKLLLDHDANPCIQDLQGMTPLHLAATNCHNSCHVFRILLDKGVDPKCLDNKGRTALHYASEHSDKDSIKILLDHGADPCVQDLQGKTPLHLSARCDDGHNVLEIRLKMGMIQHFFDKRGIMVFVFLQTPEVQNQLGMIPLNPKSFHPNLSMALPFMKTLTPRTYITRNEFEKEYGTLLLAYRRIEVLEMLLKVNPNIQDHEGRTALHYAAHASRKGTLELLSKLGINAHEQNDQDRAFFQSAAVRSYHSCESVKLLLRQGVDKNIRDKHGKTAEHYVTELSYIKL